jgi:HSP20 family protein
MSLFTSLIRSSNEASASPEGDPATTRRPHYEIRETESAYNLTVYLPGVAKDGLEITDEEGELRITGKAPQRLPEGAVALHRESPEAPFDLVLSHDNTVDAEKIEAELKDGVLHLSLAKAESAKPRKISVS